MNRKIKFSPEEYYHVYNRGVEKRNIFMNKSDYNRFILNVYLSNLKLPVAVRNTLREKGDLKSLCQGGTLAEMNEVETLVDVGLWCLMPNHFHLLLREKAEGGITAFLRKLSTGYSMYFNKKYNRVGPLLQGTFKAEHVNHDNHLKYLYSYIHLNPIKLIDSDWKEKGIKNIKRSEVYLDGYKFSSYLDYLEKGRAEEKILNSKVFPEYFLSNKDFKKEIVEWLAYNPNQISL